LIHNFVVFTYIRFMLNAAAPREARRMSTLVAAQHAA
jgi:hypothetical protein